MPKDGKTEETSTLNRINSQLIQGKVFWCNYSQTVNSNGAKTIIALKTPADETQIGIFPIGTVTGESIASIVESPTITDNTGATLNVVNKNRNSNRTSKVIDRSQNPDLVGSATYFTSATAAAVTGGLILASARIGDGVGPATPGASTPAGWILKRDTIYAFIIESAIVLTNNTRIELTWWENPR